MNAASAIDTQCTIDDDFLARCAELKRELVQYAKHNRFVRAFRAMTREYDEPQSLEDEFTAVNLIDRFALQYTLHDGSTVVERFVEQFSDKLTDDECSMLLGWQDVVEGVFEVEKHDDGGIVAVNLVDDLEYRIYSNMGRDVFDMPSEEWFLIGRVVPIRDAWMLSGILHTRPADDRDIMYHAAAKLAMDCPYAVFRNPEKRARAWQIQRDERQLFIEFFGSDLVVVPASELHDRMQEFMHYRTYEGRGADGKTTAERVAGRRGGVPTPVEWPVPDPDDAETIAAIYDQDEGPMFLLNFGHVEAVFAEPELAAAPEHRDMVLGYLTDDTVSPLAFRRLAGRDVEAANRVFRTVLDRPDFDWFRDGEALMEAYKPDYFGADPAPSVTVLSDRLAEAILAARSSD
ncbi:hypothetical protein [Phytoactinopolyspora halotolerans]|uniref:Uncharacterized protein n=1 Tax=Phytoactinopolyspora halotolerans TaxID=1981512 RepID=A0A6L9SI80_9ACTN|nr:hypothetical protein [Phytoactinopolyspora halotolerans]NEE03770.1 hypothetical protein [Phytoactinopolyspora halotolerans]